MTRRKDPSLDAAGTLPEPDAAAMATDLPGLAPEAIPELTPAADTRAPRRAGIFGPLIGGALAALGGFAIAHFNLLGYAAPDRLAEMTALIEELDATLALQANALTEAKATLSGATDRIAALEAAPLPQLPDLAAPLADLDRRLATIETLAPTGDVATAALAAKLRELEQRLAALPVVSEDPGMQAELEAALARLTAAEAEAKSRAEEAEAATAIAARDLALDALAAAVAEGRPFAAELANLADPAMTEALGSMADAGVPSLETLQADFPDAAREALRLARASDTEAGWGARLVDFLAAQTGARSVAPREGDDPDAILSRAEFALSEGRIADVLTELQALDPAWKAPLDPWIASAEIRARADTALAIARGE